MSVGVPEVTTPLVMMLGKTVKASVEGGEGREEKWRAKDAGMVKAPVDRVEESATWVEEKRKGLGFGPGRDGEVGRGHEGKGGGGESVGEVCEGAEEGEREEAEVVVKGMAFRLLPCLIILISFSADILGG